MSAFAPLCPPRTRQGAVRRVGIELEFNGMSLPEAAEAVREALGGQMRQDHEHRFSVEVPTLGEFEVTFDSTLLSNRRYEEVIDGLGVPLPDGVKGLVGSALRAVGDAVLPL